MSTAASGLRELHQLHIKSRQVQESLVRGPNQIKARRQFAERKQADLDAQKEHLTSLKMLVDQKNLQLKTNENKIADLKLKLNTASSNREFDVLKGQIEADTMANSVLEDEILECLDKIDTAQVATGKLNEETEAAGAEERRIAQEVTSAEPGLRQESESLAASIAESESTLPGEVAVVYRRLVQAHGSGALAPVEGGACTECFVGLSPQSCVELNAGKILFCRHCGRLLYQEDR